MLTDTLVMCCPQHQYQFRYQESTIIIQLERLQQFRQPDKEEYQGQLFLEPQ